MVTSPTPTYTVFPLGQNHPTLEPSVVPADAGGAHCDDRAQGCQQPPTCWSERSSLLGYTCPAHSRIATIPHSVTQDRACRVCLQHSSPGPGNGPEHEVPPAFFLHRLPGKLSVCRQHWRDPVTRGIAARLRALTQGRGEDTVALWQADSDISHHPHRHHFSPNLWN